MDGIIEYVAVSIDVGKHGDPDAKNLAEMRRDLASDWNEPKDLIRIGRAYPNHNFNIGYLGMVRSKNLFYWVNRDGVARRFDPKTGKLGQTIRLPARERKLIWDEETWELKEGLSKSRSIRRL